MAYSTDDNLGLYYDRVSQDGPFTAQHDEATREIDRRLRAQGLTTDQISHLSAQTKTDLVPAACYFVLHLVFLLIDRAAAMDYHKLFLTALNSVAIEVDEDADTVASDSLRLGGYMRLG